MLNCFSIGTESICIGKLPGRKRICLYTAENSKMCGEIRPLAYFKDEEDAELVNEWLTKLAEANSIVKE